MRSSGDPAKALLGRRLRRLRPIVGLLIAWCGAQVALRTAPLAPVQVLAHRGGSVHAPENTLAAFRRAIDLGVDWLELDVQRTKDGVLVVIHDETVDRTTNGTGRVADLTSRQIRALDAGDGGKVPTFREVVDLARAGGVGLFPETKAAHLYPGIEAGMLKTLRDAGYVEHAIIQSFEEPSLATLRRLDPTVRRAALLGLWKLSAGSPPGDAQVVCPMAETVLLNPYMVRQAHRQGRQVMVWFGALEHPLMYRFLAFFGVDGIISDDPAAVQRALR